MSLARAAVTVGVVLALTAGGVAPVAACMADAECDNGDTCALPDLCLAGSCVLGGGGDLDGDLVCDAEEDPSFSFELTKVVVRRRTAARRDNSSIKGTADLLYPAALGPFIGAAGLAIRVKDALSVIPPAGDGVDVTFTWGAGECSTAPSGRIRCRSGDGLSSAEFKPSPTAPDLIAFSFKIKGGTDLAGPFFGPIRVVLTRATALHQGAPIGDCRLTRSGIQCRVF